MRKITLGLLLVVGSIFNLSAQYTTPGTGVDWTLDDVSVASPATISVTGTTYTLLEDLTIAADDILRIDTDLTLEIEAGVRLTVLDLGTFIVDAGNVLITAVDETLPYDGFRFEEGSEIYIQNAIIQFGGGLQVLTETFTLNNCIIQNNVSGVTTGAVVNISRGVPVITNNQFLFNANPAIGSGANQSVSALILNNYIEGNNQTNNNRPQINVGVTRPSDTLKIIGNTILGDRAMTMAGGIAIANFVGGSVFAIIENNTITDNRFGITVMGNNDYIEIKNNVIEDNDTQNSPMDGGSGINFLSTSGDQNVIISKNRIRRNLWGVTIQQQSAGNSNLNFGDDIDNPGLNIFSENGNNGEIFALYNNGPNTISAKHNCWVENGDGTLAEAEGVIFHFNDDSTLGEVLFDPIDCSVLSVSDTVIENFMFYPNPAKNEITFTNIHLFDTVEIFDIQGKRLSVQTVSNGINVLPLDLKSGLYIINFKSVTTSVAKKLIVE